MPKWSYMAKKIPGYEKTNPPPDPMQALAKAEVIRQQKMAALNKVSVVLQVKDHEHARSSEVMEFCLKELAAGTSYSALRRKLGVGPAHLDRRWRIIREGLVDVLLPATDEEALKANYSVHEYMMGKLDEMHEYIETRALAAAGTDDEAQFLKLWQDSWRLMSEKYETQYKNYLSLKKLKSAEKATRGVSIVINQNFKIPRPGDDIQDVTPKVQKIASRIKRDE